MQNPDKPKSALALLIRCLGKIPQPVMQRILVPLLMVFFWYGRSESRRIIEINLAHCFRDLPEAERSRLAKASVRESLRTMLEFPFVLTAKPERILAKIVKTTGLEYVKQAQEAGKGLLFLSPHLGNWEFLGLQVAHDFPLTGMFKPGRIQAINDLLLKTRESSGGKLVPANRKGVLAVLKALKKGEASGILPDQIPEVGNGCAFVEFFGQEAATMTLISNLVQKTDSAAIGCFAKRLPCGNFEIIYQPAHTDIYSDDIEISARGLNKTVEALIHLAPEQYQWVYKRFRVDSSGKTGLYKKS